MLLQSWGQSLAGQQGHAPTVYKNTVYNSDLESGSNGQAQENTFAPGLAKEPVPSSQVHTYSYLLEACRLCPMHDSHTQLVCLS